MKLKTILFASAGLYLVARATNPLTGKKRLSVISEDNYLIPSAYTEYSTFLQQSKIITGTPDAQMVDRVGAKITNAAIKWMTSKGIAEQIKSYQWEYHLVQDNQANAWCMPGGKIAVFN